MYADEISNKRVARMPYKIYDSKGTVVKAAFLLGVNTTISVGDTFEAYTYISDLGSDDYVFELLDYSYSN